MTVIHAPRPVPAHPWAGQAPPDQTAPAAPGRTTFWLAALSAFSIARIARAVAAGGSR